MKTEKPIPLILPFSKEETSQPVPNLSGRRSPLLHLFRFVNVSWGRRCRGFHLWLLLAAILTINPLSLQAHNVVAGAYVDGLTIEGEIGFSNGESALPDSLVEVFNEAGEKIGATKTEADGLFTFTATTAQKHILKSNLGAGHIAEIIIEASEFAAATPATRPTQSKPTKPVTAISAQELETIVRNAVTQQVKPLQRELRAYKEKIMIRDIAGGLGFIFGLFGVAAWMASRKPSKTGKDTANATVS